MMTTIDATGINYQKLNRIIRETDGDVSISGCLGQRFIAAGLGNNKIEISGIPGNALGSYLNGAEITVRGNAQDAVGDTMNDGKIVIHGNIGYAAGYAMRGGEILVRGNAGYRAGIHMKEYGEKRPVIVVGGSCGSFLGEYQAGGLIIVLGLNGGNRGIIGDFPCTGMHGGKMLLRSDCAGIYFSKNVTVRCAKKTDMLEADRYITEFCNIFGFDKKTILDSPFTVIVPDSKNPYKQMYVAN